MVETGETGLPDVCILPLFFVCMMHMGEAVVYVDVSLSACRTAAEASGRVDVGETGTYRSRQEARWVTFTVCFTYKYAPHSYHSLLFFSVANFCAVYLLCGLSAQHVDRAHLQLNRRRHGRFISGVFFWFCRSRRGE